MFLSWIHQLINPGLAFEPWCPKTYREDEAVREFRRARRQTKKREARIVAHYRAPTEKLLGTVTASCFKPGALIIAAPDAIQGINRGEGGLVPGLPALTRSLQQVWIRRWLDLDYDCPREIPVVLDCHGGIYLAEPAAQLEYELQLAAGITELRLRVLETKPPACCLHADEAAPSSRMNPLPGAA